MRRVTAAQQLFPGDGEMARRMRAFDWSATSLGPVERWPSALRTSVSTCLECAFPIVLWWGPELVFLYNDEYRSILGPAKHPAALGAAGAEVWREVWDVIGPMLSRVMTRAEATRSRDLLLLIERSGYPEEAYFSFSYSPIYDDAHQVSGVFSPVIETTDRVIGERRLRALRDLASQCTRANSEAEAYECAAAVLAQNLSDVPFALIYSVDPEHGTARLEATAGIERTSPAAPAEIRASAEGARHWPLRAVIESAVVQEVGDLRRRFADLPSGAWTAPPRSALLLPVLLPGQARPHAVLVAAVSPMRALDAQYRTFFELVANQLAAGVANARALEEERRRAAALAEIDRAKTAFFSNVSHEFRTPLTLMLGPLEDIIAERSRVLPPDVADTLAIAHRNGQRLLRLVNTLLDFSRIEAERADATYEPVDLGAATAELASVFRSAIERAGLTLAVDCPPLPEPAYVDRDMWEKIVLNLLSNALKFTFQGEIRVSLRCAGERFELSVSDTGVGIPSHALPRMFERFHRVQNMRSRTHEGTGIGLALVQELAKLHGGDVRVASEVDRGSTFTVRIPRGHAHLPAERIGAPRRLEPTSVGASPFVEEALRWLPEQSPAPSSERELTLDAADLRGAAPGATEEHTRARVLLADDNADMRDYLRRLLERAYTVEAVEDGQAALDRVHAGSPDLLLADIMMPRLTGMELLDALRADERTRTLPVILLSARAGEEARIEGLAAGADDYLVKPFSAREVLARVHSQLELSRVRRDTERALRCRSEQVEALLNNAPIGVYLVDAEFRIRAVNPVARPVFGELAHTVVGRDFDEVIHALWEKGYADEVVRVFRHTLETGEPYLAPERAEFRVDRNATEYYEWQLHRIMLPDGRYGLVCYFRDISAQVAARQAIEESRRALEDADRRKTEFLATLAHELRNPLAPVQNAVNILSLAGEDGALRERARETMDRQVSHMVRLVDDLMEVSRINRGKIDLQKRRTTVAEVVKSAIEASRPSIDAARHQLHVSVPEEPLLLDADAVRLAQVVSNLLNNAAKYTPERGQIWLSAAREGAEVVLSVRDDGSGIPTDMLSKVFELFMQADHNYNRAQGGLGIGLMLVKTLVVMHGGSVVAKSAGPGQGSEFIVRLPLVTAPVSHVESRAAAYSFAERRVLVVDDNHDAAETLGVLLELLGAHASIANDGQAALEALARHRPSIVFLDIGMPGMDGYEVARRMRQDRNGKNVTLIALTGWGQDEDRRRSKQAGFDHHLVKPLDLAMLRELMPSLEPPAAFDARA